MDKVMGMEVVEGGGQRDGDLEAFLEGQGAATMDLAAQRSRDVALRVDLLAGVQIISQFHHIIKAIAAATDVQDVDLRLVQPRDGFESLDAVELTFERVVVVKIGSVDDFDGAVSAQQASSEPNFAVAA